jgi:hypothetical protein
VASWQGREITVARGTVITPLARDLALEKGFANQDRVNKAGRRGEKMIIGKVIGNVVATKKR